MSGWFDNFKNLPGQLTELASEVLNEATEEVADPESELQVIRRKCIELEDELKAEKAKANVSDGKLRDTEELLYVARMELENVTSKYTTIVAARDEQIRQLQMEVEKSQEAIHEEDLMEQCRQTEVADLKKEIVHWKSLVVHDSMVSLLTKQREELEEKKEKMMEEYEMLVKEIVEESEKRLMGNQLIQCGATSSSESSGDILDAVLLEKEELLEEKRRLEEELRRRKESRAEAVESREETVESREEAVESREEAVESREESVESREEAVVESREEAVFVDVRERNEGIQDEVIEQRLLKITLQLAETEMKELKRRLKEFQEKELEMERLRMQNDELTAAYNELNNELEEFKENHVNVADRNRDLRLRIDALKANVIEYEERYETCKRENQETLQQLEKLTSDFERLRKGIAETKAKAETSDASITVEVEKLRDALEISKEDRDKLRADVDRFRSSINEISEEMNSLRDANVRLLNENLTLGAQLDQYDGSMKEALTRSDNDLKSFKEEFAELRRIMDIKEQCYAATIEEKQREAQVQKKLVEALQKKVVDLGGNLDEELTKENQPEEEKDASGRAWREDPRNEVSVLTEQLREALKATTEMSEECEKLRKEKEELQRQILMRQSCIDEMLAQTSVLQLQQQNAITNTALLRSELHEARVEASDIRRENEEKVREMEVLLQRELEKKEELEARLEAAESLRRDTLEGQYNTEQVTQQATRIQLLEKENEELKAIAQKKHDEAVEYYNRFERRVDEVTELKQQIVALQNEKDKEREKNEKMQRELGRLKEHLLMIEETSTREAVEAEARETALLTKLRSMEQESARVHTNVAETTTSSQATICALERSLAAAEAEAAMSREKLAEKMDEFEETSQALQSLQAVVRELSNEYEKESAVASHKIMQLQLKGEETQREVSVLSAELDREKLNRQAAEEERESARQKEAAKQAIIDDLEIRLNECTAAAASSSSSYRIDDVTLRQLFLSYFTAAVDKRAEIALLLSSILEYTPEDVEKIRQAVKPGGVSFRGHTPSIADQFIRFLERESESSRLAMQLPVKTEVARIPEDPLATGTLPSAESTAALRDILREESRNPSPSKS